MPQQSIGTTTVMCNASEMGVENMRLGEGELSRKQSQLEAREAWQVFTTVWGWEDRV